MRRRAACSFLFLASLGTGIFLGCATSDSSLIEEPPPAVDAGKDASTDRATAADVGADTNIGDTGGDAGSDTGFDAPKDAPKDAPADGPKDGPVDAPIVDAGDGGDGSTVFLVRVGDGNGAPSTAAAATFLEERRTFDGAVVRTVPLPIAANASNQPLTLSGTATSEGALSRSADGKYLTVAGYATAPGTAGVANTSANTVARVVGRIDAAGTIDTTTTLGTAFSANNVRAAVSVDGSAFWINGSGGGVEYATLGSTAPVNVLADPSNIRVLGVFGGQLYGTSGSSSFQAVFSIGTGVPTTGGATATSLTGLGGSPYGFAALDLDPNVAGVDTIYIADDGAISADAGAGGGVHKWTSNGSTWSSAGKFSDGLTTGVRGLAATATSGGAVLYLTTGENPPRLVSYVDNGANANPPLVPIATAATNTFFRGVALPPVP